MNMNGQMVKSIKYIKQTWSGIIKTHFSISLYYFSIMIDNKGRMTQIVKSGLCWLIRNKKKRNEKKLQKERETMHN